MRDPPHAPDRRIIDHGVISVNRSAPCSLCSALRVRGSNAQCLKGPEPGSPNEKGALSSKTLELLQELVNFGLVRLQAA